MPSLARRSVHGLGSRRYRILPPSQRNAYPGFTKHAFIRPTTGTAPRQLPVDHHCRHAPHAKALCPFSDPTLFHVEHGDVARRTCNTLDESDRVLTATTPGTENFDFPLLVHTIMISLDALH